MNTTTTIMWRQTPVSRRPHYEMNGFVTQLWYMEGYCARLLVSPCRQQPSFGYIWGSFAPRWAPMSIQYKWAKHNWPGCLPWAGTSPRPPIYRRVYLLMFSYPMTFLMTCQRWHVSPRSAPVCKQGLQGNNHFSSLKRIKYIWYMNQPKHWM